MKLIRPPLLLFFKKNSKKTQKEKNLNPTELTEKVPMKIA